MPRFDSGFTYDSGARYDAGMPPPLIPRRKTMAKPKLELRDKTDLQLKSFAEAVVTAMTGNPNFTTPSPPLADITTKNTTFNTKMQTIATLEAQLRTAYSEKEDARAELEQELTYLANYVEGAAKGDAAKIESAGMQVRSGTTPVGTPEAPTGLTATFGDFDGEIDLSWEPVKGAATYEVDFRLHNGTAEWARAKSTTSSRTTVGGMTSGQQYAFRVRAVGSAGPGPWSDETVKRAP